MQQQPDAPTLDHAAESLWHLVRSYGAVVVAFSGGVDSTVVAAAAVAALGSKAWAVTGRGPSVPQADLELAASLAEKIGIQHEFLDTAEFANPAYVANDGTRCYHCKSELYDRLLPLAVARQAVICSGANLDDMGDYRPGLQAAAQRQVRHPLQEAGFTKPLVRALAHQWGLSNADRPASPCLSSRLAVGVEATPQRTARVEAAEQFLRARGFEPLRVRYHAGDHARIEVSPAQLPRLVEPEMRQQVVTHLKALGFNFVAVDLEGFRSGGLNVLVSPALREVYAGAGKPAAETTGIPG